MKKYFKGFLMALSMFTIIPLPHNIWDDEGARHIMKFYPAIGVIIGFIWFGVYKALAFIEAPLMITTAIVMITPYLITGMLHLDGFMDVCDAILSRRDKEEKLRILKDSHTGAFAVISLAMLFIVDFAGVYTLLEANRNIVGLIFIPIISRSIIAYLLISKKSMKGSSLGAFFKQGTGIEDKIILITAFVLALLLTVPFMELRGIIMGILMLFVGLILVNKCEREFDGMSGDTAGFGLVMCEATGILFLALI